MHRKTTSWYAACLLSVLSLAAQQQRFYSAPSLKLSAVRLVSTQSWLSEEDCYCWQSDHSVNAFDNPASEDWKASAFDTSTKKTRLIGMFNRCFGTRQLHEPMRWAASPDGKHLIWAAGTDAQPLWMLGTMDDSSVTTYPRVSTDATQCGWIPGSQSWAEWTRKGNATTLTVHNLAGSSVKRLPGIHDSVIGFGADGSILTTSCELFGQPRQLCYGKVTAGEGQPTNVALPVTLPPAARLVRVKVSPDGRRLMWVVTHPRTLSATQLLTQRVHRPQRQPQEPQQVMDVFISDTDTNRCHLAYSQSLAPADQVQPMVQWPQSFEWTPDCRHLSFMWNNALWSVPVLLD